MASAEVLWKGHRVGGFREGGRGEESWGGEATAGEEGEGVDEGAKLPLRQRPRDQGIPERILWLRCVTTRSDVSADSDKKLFAVN